MGEGRATNRVVRKLGLSGVHLLRKRSSKTAALGAVG